jgi:hypothetical protein
MLLILAVKPAQLQRSRLLCDKSYCKGSVPVPTLTRNSSSGLEPVLTLLMVIYHTLDICFPDYHSNNDCRMFYVWNEIIHVSIHCIPTMNNQTNIYYRNEKLQGLMVDYGVQIPPCRSRCFRISTIHFVNPVHMYSQDHSLHLWWNPFQLFEYIIICTY